MLPITALSEGPVSDLIFAINHFFATGDRIGEGVGGDAGSEWMVTLAVNPKLPDDLADFERLKERLQAAPVHTRMRPEGRIPGGFDAYLLYVKKQDVRALCKFLMAAPSAQGWGTSKAVMDRAWDADLLRVARQAGVAMQSVKRASPEAIRAALAGKVSEDVLEVGLQAVGETGQPVKFWKAGDAFLLDDPTFTDHPVDFVDLVYDSEIGLHERRG